MQINTNRWNRLRYDFYAPFYDLVARPLERGRRRAIGRLDLPPGARVLLDGAGTGLDLPWLPAGVEVTAVDLSPAMLRQAEARARRLGRDVDLQVMDSHRLALPDASFDAVLLHLILAVIPDPEACIREAARVLRPAGRISIFDKFLPDERAPSLARRAAGLVTNVLFSDINRRLGPLLAHAGLEVVHQEPAGLGGFFQVALVRKAAG